MSVQDTTDAHDAAAALRRAHRDFKLARRAFIAIAIDEGWTAERVAYELARLEDAGGSKAEAS
jgi:hypothetical protein